MYIADLHIHSRYSRATSKECVPEYLDLWAGRKGIGLLGSGDFTHPAWRQELREKLVPAEEGLYTLKDEFRLHDPLRGGGEKPRFVLSGEISSIYKKNGKVRKVHNVILLPSLDAAEELARRLEAIGNVHSDGRPILGLDSHDLLEITLEACPDAIFIPAHIWTPHFSLFGAFSGFDTIEECFEDLTPQIHALETGLSSDPPMNWRLSALDRFTLVSNSDAHSPAKLGREANLMDTQLSYPAMAAALRGGADAGFGGTIEFYPEEGKYHLDGHRSCKLCLTPQETKEYGGRCPICGKKITIGVEHRVEELADRPEGFVPEKAGHFESLVPLNEVIAGSTGQSPSGVKVMLQYQAMLKELGDEFSILREVPVSDIGLFAGPCVAEGIRRLRCGEVRRTPGYDGEYGVIELLDDSEIETLNAQICFLEGAPVKQKKPKQKPEAVWTQTQEEAETEKTNADGGLNQEQEQAVMAEEPAVAVIAGPGTGKTKTLVSRIVHLIEARQVKPSEITAVTFTNKAAGEMRERLEQRFGSKRAVKAMTIGTFHSICLELLKEVKEQVALADEYEALDLAALAAKESGSKLPPKQFLQEVSKVKNGTPLEQTQLPGEESYITYCRLLQQAGVMDFDDLLLETLALWKNSPGEKQKKRFRYLLVDEFQDSNEVQYQLVRAWNQWGKSLFVIGDPDQSIYGFRGANARCFEKLEQDFTGLRTIRLVKNYRSTPQIVQAALPVITRNPGPERLLEAQRKDGELVRLVTAETDFSEGVFVAKDINQKVGGIDMLDAQTRAVQMEREKAQGFSEMAILYRTHHQAEILEKCLKTEGIPYVVAGRDDYLAADAVRGTMGFFRYLLAPDDRLALKTCLRLIWNCPADTVEPFVEQIGTPSAWTKEALEELVLPLSDGIAKWRAQMIKYLPRIKKEKPVKLLEEWSEETGLTGLKPMERFRNMAVFYTDMEAFLQNMMLGQEGDLVRSAGKFYAAGAVTLMTLHGSKGLEFPVVYLCGVKKGTLPLESDRHPADPEEERRLFFVGMTRAKEELVILTSPEPSAFLADLPARLIRQETALKRKQAPEGKQLSLFDK